MSAAPLHSWRLPAPLFLCVVVLAALSPPAARAQAPLRLVQTIPLPDVNGRLDHMAADVTGKRLFVAALGNNTLEVLDVASGRRIRSIRGFHEPQGVAYVPELSKIFVANGGDGVLTVLDGKSLAVTGRLDFSSDADNVRYDAWSQQIYVGYGEGALGIVEAPSDKRLGDVLVDGHPESFQLEASGPRIFANLPTARRIAVIDRRKRAVIARWPVREARGNFPMALDEGGRRLFVGCRSPATMLVYDTGSGRTIARLPCVGDADDLFYDAARKRIYISGGQGFLTVFYQHDPDHYRLISRIPTAAGARTSLYVPALSRLYLAVPRRSNQGSEIRVYEAR
jgi:DNA-binding beta-propeller fold protein YncE